MKFYVGDWALNTDNYFRYSIIWIQNGEQVIISAMVEGLHILTDANSGYCDGNFNLDFVNLIQVCVIRVPKNDFSIN